MTRHPSSSGPPAPAADLPSVRGTLRLSRLGQSYGVGEPLTHRTTFVNGPDYGGATDNDLRGFLDGGFAWGWNQATQVHVRLGRLGGHAKPLHGEEELFRVVQRWDEVRLPPGVDVVSAALTVEVEEPPAQPVRLLLYAVRRDWGPGAGGVHRNNVSKPAEGEVWWGAPVEGTSEWGLPGAGFAADADARADTDAMPLAEVEVGTEGGQLTFSSSRLTGYAEERVRLGKPVLFLLKLPDDSEDTPGTFFSLYSTNHGDRLNEARRPRLELGWQSRREAERREQPVHLEQARTLELDRLDATEGTWVASFHPEPGSPQPTLEARWGRGDVASEWSASPVPAPQAEWIQWRVRAFRQPLPLGEAFITEVADTWVVTGPPEAQTVEFWFTSPSGAEHRVLAEYQGGWRWTARLVPDEVGRWRYRWSQGFWSRPYESPVGEFDVFGDDLETLCRHLDRVADAVEVGTMARVPAQRRMLAFQRAALKLLDPDTFRGPDGEAVRATLRRVRSAIWGRPVPDPLPRVSHDRVSVLHGQELAEPIPDGRGYGVYPDGQEPRPAPARGGGGSLAGRVRRAVRRVLGGSRAT